MKDPLIAQAEALGWKRQGCGWLSPFTQREWARSDEMLICHMQNSRRALGLLEDYYTTTTTQPSMTSPQ